MGREVERMVASARRESHGETFTLEVILEAVDDQFHCAIPMEMFARPIENDFIAGILCRSPSST